MSNIVGKRLKIIRNTMKYSQKDFANYLDVSIRSYERWEQGKNISDVNNLIKIADKLNINIDFILGRTDAIITYYNYKDIDKYFNEGG
ncbi:helix-turn-helix domain-containing protein [Tissierella sp. MSJ-40]|uniref:Helix-turn-helix domain-containing protein n=1 Tax=Tissierella simiarum TaxID=2841534 RepID=A0ABS6EBF4_9FIRM|nr:helix-turn-helix transcriptional regulator [Tissierella simiarum]MBU5440264.1 helix-turn-helix domain-containing protein [Tissierella simiarum]